MLTDKVSLTAMAEASLASGTPVELNEVLTIGMPRSPLS
jgi:hypothetical protein